MELWKLPMAFYVKMTAFITQLPALKSCRSIKKKAVQGEEYILIFENSQFLNLSQLVVCNAKKKRFTQWLKTTKIIAHSGMLTIVKTFCVSPSS